jgi:hypothetical protein
MSPNEKNCCNNLSNGNNQPLDSIHPNYHITFPLVVCENVLIFAPTLFLFLVSSLSHTSSFSVSPLGSSPPFYPSHIKVHNILSWVIIVFNKVVWHTSRCFTYERLITIILFGYGRKLGALNVYEIDTWPSWAQRGFRFQQPCRPSRPQSCRRYGSSIACTGLQKTL